MQERRKIISEKGEKVREQQRDPFPSGPTTPSAINQSSTWIFLPRIIVKIYIIPLFQSNEI